jgi:pyridoxine kinase
VTVADTTPGLPLQVLSIQSSVAYGHAGNSAAAFPLQRLGVEVWPVHTVHFSNHTGYGAWKGPVLASADVAAVIEGIEDLEVFSEFSAVLSGYQGAEEVGQVILDTVAKVTAANPGAVYCCDPVMGDTGRGFFVREGIPEFMRSTVVPAADIVTPNQFELEYLAPGHSIFSTEDLLASAANLRALGPSTVLVTSVRIEGIEMDEVGMAVVTDDGAWLVKTPLLPVSVNGAGDAVAAIFLAHLLKDGDAPAALAKVASSIFAILQNTAALDRRELALVGSGDQIADPACEFPVLRIA